MEGVLERERVRIPPEHGGFYNGGDVIDRGAIEAQAWELIANRELLDDIEVAHQERRDNARTALWEGLTSSGHLSRIELQGSLEDINAQVLNRLLRGWSDRLPGHEQKRRFHEICEELTIQRTHQAIVAGELPASTAVAVISDFPETIAQKSAQLLGYRPDNKKGMVRSTHLVEYPKGTYTRIIEQISRSNGTWQSTSQFFRAAGIRPPHREAGDLTALGTPIIYSTRDYSDGVVDIQRCLDYHAGPGVRYGEKIGTNPQHVDYERVREESQVREQQAEGFLDEIAAYEAQLDDLLDQGRITRKQRDSQYGKKILQTLRIICTVAPQYATDCFGQDAAGYYQRASEWFAAGNYEAAQRIIDDAREHERVVIICGGSLSDEEEKVLGLSIESLAEGLQDAEDKYGSLRFKCQLGHDNVRPRNKLIDKCKTCGISVKC